MTPIKSSMTAETMEAALSFYDATSEREHKNAHAYWNEDGKKSSTKEVGNKNVPNKSDSQNSHTQASDLPKAPIDEPAPDTQPAEPNTQPAEHQAIEYTIDAEEYDRDLVSSLSETLNQAGVSNDQFGQMVGAYDAHLINKDEANIKAVQNDREFKGFEFDEKMGIAKNGLDVFGGSKLLDALAQAGVANHPEVIRAFYKIGLHLEASENKDY